MRKLLAAAVAGTLAGDLAFTAIFLLGNAGQGAPVTDVLDVGPQLLWVASILSFPGSLFLGWVIARRLRQAHLSRGAVLARGTLWGWGLGTLHLFLVLRLTSEGYLTRAFRDPSSEAFAIVCSGMVGAAAHGLACAWWISRPAKEAA